MSRYEPDEITRPEAVCSFPLVSPRAGGPRHTDTDGGHAYSVSALATYETCPFQYFRQYVSRLPPPVTPAMRRGTRIHALIKKHYTHPALVLPDIDADVSERFECFLTSRFNTAPVAAELPFRLPIGSAFVSGRIDTVLPGDGGRLEIVDFKSGMAPGGENLEERLQLQVYVLAAMQQFSVPAEAVDFTYFFLADGKEFRFTGTAQGVADTIERTASLIRAIESGEFTPRPECGCFACRRRRQ